MEVHDTDPSLILLHGGSPIRLSSDLEVVPYPTLWLDSCDAYCISYMLVSYTSIKKLYFNLLYNGAQYFCIRIPPINADNVTQPVKLCIDLPYFRAVMISY